MLALSLPGRTRTEKRTASTASPTAISGSPSTSESMVAGTAPSTEFSTGTQPASAPPTRTASSTSGTVSSGTISGAAPMPGVDSSTKVRAACSVNVPCGPK